MSDENENFNEVDTLESDNEGGNFNEVEPSASDTASFNETDSESFNVSNPAELSEESFSETLPASLDDESFHDSSESFNDAAGSAPENESGIRNDFSPNKVLNEYGTPTKSSTPKVMIGVVVGLALVIVGLIIFLVVSIMNKKKDEPSSANPTPTNISTEIVVDGTPDKSNDSSSKSDTGNNSTDSNNTDNSSTDNADSNDTITEAPTFNVTVELGQYKGVTVDYKLPEVTDEDVQGALDYFASSLEEEVPITDRPLAEGDYVVLDYVGTIDGEVFDGGSATGDEYELGSHLFIDGFEEGIIGKKVGDSLSLDLTFPEDYGNADVAGKPVNFQVNITDAYNYVTPELTDELVAKNSDYKTIAEYEAAAREELKDQAIEYADSQAKNDIIQKIISNSTFGGQIDEQIAYEVQDCIDYYDYICSMQFGVDGATYFGYLWGLTEAEYLAMVNEESTTSVKYNAILDEIAKKENLTVSEEEFEEMFQQTFIDYYGFETKEDVYAELGEEETNSTINGYVLHDKAEAIIFDSAIINK